MKYIFTDQLANTEYMKGVWDILCECDNDLPKQYIMPYISTRTWSKNAYHILGLEHMGFNAVNTIINHRGPGIDTVYFALKL